MRHWRTHHNVWQYGGLSGSDACTRERTYRDSHIFRVIEKVRERIKLTQRYYTNITQPNTIPFTYRVEAM